MIVDNPPHAASNPIPNIPRNTNPYKLGSIWEFSTVVSPSAQLSFPGSPTASASTGAGTLVMEISRASSGTPPK